MLNLFGTFVLTMKELSEKVLSFLIKNQADFFFTAVTLNLCLIALHVIIWTTTNDCEFEINLKAKVFLEAP